MQRQQTTAYDPYPGPAVPVATHAGAGVRVCRAGFVFFGCVAFGLLAGCGRREAAPEPLARVGDVSITEDDFNAEVGRRRESGRFMGDAQSVLREMIERQVMLQEAARAPWMNEPAARRERENQMLGQWLDRTLQAEKNRAAVSDEEVRRHYTEHLQDFTRPAMARLAILHRRTTPQTPKADAEALAVELRRARQTFLDDRAGATKQGRIPGFGAIAAQASEDTVSRYRGGDLGWLDVGRTDYRWPVSVVKAGFALPEGGISEVLEAEDGLYVVMKQAERAASVAPFEEAAVTLRRQLLRQKQESAERDFKSNLLARASVRINAERAARLSVPVTALKPEADAVRPAPDFLPPSTSVSSNHTLNRASEEARRQ